MDWKTSCRIISYISLLIFTACSNTSITATSTNKSINSTEAITATSSPVDPLPLSTTSDDTTSAAFCANAYYPVRQGATWLYQSTGSPSGDYGFTDRITSVREAGFTLTTEYENFTNSQDWSCSPEGLSALQLGGPIVAALQSQAIHLDLDVKNVSGITFPYDIAPGDAWQYSLEFEGDMDIAGEEGTASGTAQMNFSALGTERVSVPAGDFDAMKIQVDTLVNLNVNYEGLTVPVAYTATYTYWFAPNVGWVKADGQADMAEQSFSEHIGLQTYNVP